MSPAKPLRPPASFEVFSVYTEDDERVHVDSLWANRTLAERRAAELGTYGIVGVETVWRDAEAFKEAQS